MAIVNYVDLVKSGLPTTRLALPREPGSSRFLSRNLDGDLRRMRDRLQSGAADELDARRVLVIASGEEPMRLEPPFAPIQRNNGFDHPGDWVPRWQSNTDLANIPFVENKQKWAGPYGPSISTPTKAKQLAALVLTAWLEGIDESVATFND